MLNRLLAKFKLSVIKNKWITLNTYVDGNGVESYIEIYTPYYPFPYNFLFMKTIVDANIYYKLVDQASNVKN